LKRLGPNLMRSQMLVQPLTRVVCSVRLVALFPVSLIGCSNSGRLISFTVQILSANAKANGRHPDLLGCFPLFRFSRDSHFAPLNIRRAYVFPAEVKVNSAPMLQWRFNSDRHGRHWLTVGLFETVSTQKFHKKNRKILTRRDYFYFFVPILWRK